MRPLTKSRFKLALECPTKLFYTRKALYEDPNASDPFMEALAEGGYQVGELAKLYYPGGHDITEKDYDESLRRTNELMQQDNVIIYEAAIKFENLFIRVDILEKKGNQINLIEVKAKSYDGGGSETFLSPKGHVDSGWAPYLQDVSFQKYVAQKAFPDCTIRAYLMLADKSRTASVDGLNQLFQIQTDSDGRIYIQVKPNLTPSDLGDPILSTVDVDGIADRYINDTAGKTPQELGFEEKIQLWSEAYANDEKINSLVGAHCFNCEFKGQGEASISGFNACWKHNHPSLTDSDLQKPMINQVWNFRKKTRLLADGKFFVEDLTKEDIGSDVNPKANHSLSAQERQWLQVEKMQTNDHTYYLDRDLLKAEMASFTYPLHFIDFETSAVAIPFYKGQRPYEQVAFQFSHHTIDAQGKVSHVSEFIETRRGKFPNFEFLRALKETLSQDEGTIFRYAPHENTILNKILEQLQKADATQVPDREELMNFIKEITHDSGGRKGRRDMVDMWRMVKDYYYDPLTNGSNSIKDVLPSVLNRSKFIQETYSEPIYGHADGIQSLNFKEFVWIERDEDGQIVNPYDLLPPVFESKADDELADRLVDPALSNGGAAMVAFAKLQFENISDEEREQVINALLRYCELDTLAMVFIYQFWMEEVGIIVDRKPLP